MSCFTILATGDLDGIIKDWTMKKGNIWTVLVIVYALIIAAVVFYRLSNREPVQQISQQQPLTTSQAASAETILSQYVVESDSGEYKEVTLRVVDPSTFESAGYTLELGFDPSVLELVDIQPGNVWEKSVVFQKEIASPGKLVYSVGRSFGSRSMGGDILARVRFRVINDQAIETTLGLSQTSISAGEAKKANMFIAEPLVIRLK